MSVLLTFTGKGDYPTSRLWMTSAIHLCLPPNVLLHCRSCGHGFRQAEVFPVEGPKLLDEGGYECRFCVALDSPVSHNPISKVIALPSYRKTALYEHCGSGNTDTDGHGYLSISGKRCKAHRAAYISSIGPIRQDYSIARICRNRKCCRPSHLNIFKGTCLNSFLVSDLNRFESHYIKTDTCWLWLASKTKKGYGQSSYKGRYQAAHRVSYLLYVGNIPQGMFVCHKCDNPPCVNPDHLFLGTNQDNMG